LGIVNSGWQIVNLQGNVLGNVEPWHKLPNLNLEAWVAVETSIAKYADVSAKVVGTSGRFRSSILSSA
jgi:hypothetical protein